MLLSELLNEQVLTEKLGNLRALNVGSMINILKQGTRYHGRGSNKDKEALPTGKKFPDQYPTIGSTSEIIDVGPIKNGIGGLRKALKDHENAEAFALYVNDKAVCFGLFDSETLGGSSRERMFAYDLSQFKDKLEADAEEKRKKASDWEKKSISARDLSSYREKPDHDWIDNKRVEKTSVYHGSMNSTAMLKSFLEELFQLAGNKPVTCKLVIKDSTAQKKRSGRYTNKLSKSEVLTGLEALKTRLQKYKISKKPTAKSIEEFLAMAGGAAKVVQFGGRGYSTTIGKGWDSDKISPEALLAGKSFSIKYACVDPGSHEDIEITYAFDKETGTLKPFKAKWKPKGDDPTKYDPDQSVALGDDSSMYLKHELKIKTVDKDSIVKAILIKVKDGATLAAKEMIAAARKGGHDYPEFKAIEKSIDASKKKDE